MVAMQKRALNYGESWRPFRTCLRQRLDVLRIAKHSLRRSASRDLGHPCNSLQLHASCASLAVCHAEKALFLHDVYLTATSTAA